MDGAVTKGEWASELKKAGMITKRRRTRRRVLLGNELANKPAAM